MDLEEKIRMTKKGAVFDFKIDLIRLCKAYERCLRLADSNSEYELKRLEGMERIIRCLEDGEEIIKECRKEVLD